MAQEKHQSSRTIILRAAVLSVSLVVVGVVVLVRFGAGGPDSVCGESCYTGTYASGALPERYVALTFDDGPAGDATDTILSVLAAHDTPATFFMLGENIFTNPDQVREVYEAGHLIGNHTYSHRATIHADEERIVSELNKTNTMIESLTGRSAVLYRPPYLKDLAPFEVQPKPDGKPVWSWVYGAGYIPVGVDMDSDDWAVESTEEALEEVRDVLEKKRQNYFGVTQHVFLFHDDPYTAQVLPDILALIKEEGYEIVPLTTILGLSRETVMPPAQRTLAHYATAPMLAGSDFMVQFVLIISVLIAAAALFRIGIFISFKLKKRPREKLDTQLLPRFEGTISVLIPAYNESENVQATILSVLQNTRQPDEIIVIDDGSTDDTLSRSRAVEAAYPGLVRVVHVQNGGKAAALNVGIAQARGDVVIAIDGDTVLHAECIDAVSRPFVHKRTAAVAGKILPARTETTMERYQYIEYVAGQNIDKQFISGLGSVHIVPGAVGAWRRRALLAVGGYSGDTLVEDQDLTLALLGRNYGVVYMPSAVAYTEVPTTFSGFYLQRFRWTYGTFQCLYKYRSYLFGGEALRLGWVSLPYSLVFNVLMPITALVLNLSVVLGVLVGVVHPGFLMLAVFTALDMAYAYTALLDEGERSRRLVFLVPVQRLAYLAAYSIIVFLVLVKFIDGSPTRWNKLTRNGSAARLFEEKTLPVPTPYNS